MKVYFYAKSGHTIGLEATKKCAAIANILKDFDPILCTSDFRAGAFAKELLGINKYVNVDVIRNMTNLMQKNDILLYDSNEVNEDMKKDMKTYCSLVYDLNSDFGKIIVDTTLYTNEENKNSTKTIFFGDDDYNKLFLDMVNDSEKYDINLLMGHYFFLGNEKIFTEHFKNVIDEEEYVETIKNSKYLLTGSLQTALESISCGNNPVLLLRDDKVYDLDLIKSLNIPTIKNDTLASIIEEFENIIKNYPTLNELTTFNSTKLVNEITNKIEQFKKLTNNN